MKKLLLIASVALLSFTQPTTYYICTGPKSHAYHVKKDCKGLEHCSTEIKPVSKEDAVALHRTPCHYCIH